MNIVSPCEVSSGALFAVPHSYKQLAVGNTEAHLGS